MKFIYQDKQYSLAELKKEQQAFEKDLEVPNYLRKTVQPKLLGFDSGYCIAYDFLDDVYSQIASARYALLMGHKKLHDSNYISWSSGEIGQYWLRYEYLKNSIIWYSASYEMLWQALWFGYFLFRKLEFKIKNKIVKFHEVDSKETYQQLLTLCTYKNLNRALKSVSTEHSKSLFKQIDDFHITKEQKILRGWVNKLKHRGNIKARELYFSDGIQLEVGMFNSIYTTPEIVAIDEIVNVVKGYHVKFLKLTDYVYNFFNFTSVLQNQGNIDLQHLNIREYKKIIIE